MNLYCFWKEGTLEISQPGVVVFAALTHRHDARPDDEMVWNEYRGCLHIACFCYSVQLPRSFCKL